MNRYESINNDIFYTENNLIHFNNQSNIIGNSIEFNNNNNNQTG